MERQNGTYLAHFHVVINGGDVQWTAAVVVDHVSPTNASWTFLSDPTDPVPFSPYCCWHCRRIQRTRSLRPQATASWSGTSPFVLLNQRSAWCWTKNLKVSVCPLVAPQYAGLKIKKKKKKKTVEFVVELFSLLMIWQQLLFFVLFWRVVFFTKKNEEKEYLTGDWLAFSSMSHCTSVSTLR